MKKSIETIWQEGFLEEQALQRPPINALYNQKSSHLVERLFHRLQKEMKALIWVAIFIFIFNLILDNDNSVFGGIISALPCIPWYFLGKKQLKSLQEIDYGDNCYEYLISIQEKLRSISLFNKRLAVGSVPIILFPMLVYTYFKQRGKTIGEIFGIEQLDWSSLTLFLLLPLMTFIAYVIAELAFKKAWKKDKEKIDALLRDMETLRNGL